MMILRLLSRWRLGAAIADASLRPAAEQRPAFDPFTNVIQAHNGSRVALLSACKAEQDTSIEAARYLPFPPLPCIFPVAAMDMAIAISSLSLLPRVVREVVYVLLDGLPL